MTEYHGELRKMQAKLSSEGGQPVQYWMILGEQRVFLNDQIGESVSLHYHGQIYCIHCARKTSKSFNQGYCYPCFRSLAQCDLCIVSPEKCHYHSGTCRDPSWGDDFCMTDHIVYLANSSTIKVGITRATQIPVRWIDQGAVQALPIYRVQTRQQSGLVEVVFKSHIADKTNWRAMLKGSPDRVDLSAKAVELKAQLGGEISALQQQYGLQAIQDCDQTAVDIHYPVLQYPEKITSLNFDKTPIIKGRLLGIKGQYLLLDGGVINLRKFSGYNISLSV